MITNNAIYQLSGADLMQFADKLIDQTKKQLEADIQAEKSERYLSSNEVCEMLSIQNVTLWRWAKRSYIQAIKVGGKTRYKYSEVKRIAEGGR